MLKSVEGIVTRTIKYGETSVILDLLTPHDGLRSYIISGVRKKAGKRKNLLIQVLNLVKAEVYIKEHDKLSRIKELSYNYVYKSLPFDVVKISIATFLIEVCRKSVKASDDYPAIYNYVVKGLVHLDNQNVGLAHFHITFLIELARMLGFEITNNYDAHSKFFNLKEGCFSDVVVDHRSSLDHDISLQLSEYLVSPNYQGANKTERKGLLIGLVDYYKYHIEGFGNLKSLDVLMTIFT